MYAIKGYRTDEGKSTTNVVKKFGTVEESRRKMKKAAADLDYAAAARYRDEMWALEEYLKVWKD